ncbi:hypothetical protein LFL97_38645 (plasmid) [Burkholderia sp. JSH-S8]|nr:hypothetical protein LFL97_38645 [Burkholderia sp. JSH-S8]
MSSKVITRFRRFAAYGRLTVALLAAACAAPSGAVAAMDASTVAGKVLVGYQGWFRCPGDGSPDNRWSHWSAGNATPSASTLTVDAYPDVSGLPAASLCSVSGMTIQGQQAYLFSSYPPGTTQTHFAWMKQYGIDGALVQRFAVDIDHQRRENEAILKNVKAAAEHNDRVFAIEYDLTRDYTGLPDDAVLSQLQTDWLHLVNDLGLTASPSYLRYRGKPLVSLWGLGFNDKNHVANPQLAARIIAWFRQTANVSVMGGVPTGWGTPGTRSSSADPAWPQVYASLDVVQPWAVGNYVTPQDVDNWKIAVLQPDLTLAKKNGQLYLPVVFPGFSWHNLFPAAPANQVPRLGGAFLWRQVYDAVSSGAAAVKIAMFDEVNEGTAIFNVAGKRGDAPDQGYWLTLDADGRALPSDWYLRFAYEAARMVRGESPVTDVVPANPGPQAAGMPACGALGPNQGLDVGQAIVSCDGRFKLVLQGDGNLVSYQGGMPVWNNGVSSRIAARVVMQGDGNLVEFDTAGRSLWSSDTAGRIGAYAQLQSDGRFIVTGGQSSTSQ